LKLYRVAEAYWFFGGNSDWRDATIYSDWPANQVTGTAGFPGKVCCGIGISSAGARFYCRSWVQFCCGITWNRSGDVTKGQTVTDLTIKRLASDGAQIVVHWCPSCDVHFSDVVIDRDAKPIPFEVTNAPAFLADLSRCGLMPWRYTVTGRAALHCHKGRDGHELIKRTSANSYRTFPDFSSSMRSPLQRSSTTIVVPIHCV